jgi:RNA polymerase sigma-70 factor (ECF subfamily)
MDADSFRDLMVTHGQAVWNFAYFLTKRHDLADDISQDVFIQAYRKIASFRGEASMRTWLFTITRNISVNYMRTAFIRRVTLVGLVMGKDTAASAEQEVMDRNFTEDIWSLVLKLPIKYREVLILDAKYELTTREMAEILNVSEGTVKSRLSRARQKMSVSRKEEVASE